MSVREMAPIDVLIVDDDDAQRFAVRSVLEGGGYACAEARTGGEALELARRRPPRCVLLDLGLPDMDGLDVARALRARAAMSAASIHCLTGRAESQERWRASAGSCDRFLTKPVPPSALLDAVRGPAALVAAGLTFAAAEDLLDWLEGRGCSNLDAALEDAGVTVFGHPPPGLRLERGPDGAVGLLPVGPEGP